MNVWTDDTHVYIEIPTVKSGNTHTWYTITANDRAVGVIQTGAHITLPRSLFHPGYNRVLLSELTSQGYGADIRIFQLFNKDQTYTINQGSNRFVAGDILIACDNSDGSVGYMGHAAIVVDSHSLVESVPHHPQVRKDTIAQFIAKHPHYAVYRPKQTEMGRKAALFALHYVYLFNEKQKQGVPVPKYSLSKNIEIDEPMEFIYCSKLVWLCYYYGAHYKFPNDFLWFAPEDLDACLEQDSKFDLLYKHPDFHFKVDV